MLEVPAFRAASAFGRPLPRGRIPGLLTPLSHTVMCNRCLWRLPRTILFALCVAAGATPFLASAAELANLSAARASITAEELKQQVFTLASDAFGGREAGKEGGQRAAAFLVDRLQALDVAPAGPGGGYYQPFGEGLRNVLVKAPGTDPALRREWIVVGAHYDHVGLGSRRNSRGGVGQIHNGADDNASGAAALLELAEALTLVSQGTRRSVLIIFFDGEEQGMLGSKHWIRHPTAPLADVAAMINLDMIGRLRNDELTVIGTRTSPGFRRRACEVNEAVGLTLKFPWRIRGQSDQVTFAEAAVPMLMLHTGLHDDYHTPRDDADWINTAGMRRVCDYLLLLTCSLADGERPAYRFASREERERDREKFERPLVAPDKLGARFAEVFEDGTPGLMVADVASGSVAQRAGLKAVDRLMGVGGCNVASVTEAQRAVFGAAGPTVLSVLRGIRGEPMELTAAFPADAQRIGIAWRGDPAEPLSVMISEVAPGSPAADAGLAAGDRIYALNGRAPAGQDVLYEEIAVTPFPLALTIERDGRIATVLVGGP